MITPDERNRALESLEKALVLQKKYYEAAASFIFYYPEIKTLIRDGERFYREVRRREKEDE